MISSLDTLVHQAQEAIRAVETLPQWEAVKARFVGPQGLLTACMKQMGSLPAAEKPAMGKAINAVKGALEALFAKALADIDARILAAKIGPVIDPTLPLIEGHFGARHPLSQVKARVYSIFKSLGFSVADGTEVESEWACFDALNVPAGHPSRAEKDTYYFPQGASFPETQLKGAERLLLRTHTSSVQIRTMLAEKPPLKVVSIGRCFRRDTADATHSANFHQVESLCVDENVTVVDMKAMLDHFLKAFFGPAVKTRFRPSFFPFTEPSFEVDMISPDLGKLSNQWIEILGCGRVNPAVLREVGLDPAKWSGYATGMGLERLAMIHYRVDDIRHFYQNDIRFLLPIA